MEVPFVANCGKTVGSGESVRMLVSSTHCVAKSEKPSPAFGSCSIRVICAWICDDFESALFSAALSSASSGIVDHSQYDKREAISYWLKRTTWVPFSVVVAGACGPSSHR